MIFYGSYKAKSPCRIDFIEFEFPEVPEKFVPEDFDTNKNLILSATWDESDWMFDDATGEGSFRMKGVDVNQVYANGCLDMFRNAILDCIQVYGPEDAEFVLTGLEVYDAGDTFEFPEEKLQPREYWYEED